jgi:photosystem II stability/assembly factor-like uncharacterized protein
MSHAKLISLLFAVCGASIAAFALASHFATPAMRGGAPNAARQHEPLQLVPVGKNRDYGFHDIALLGGGIAWAIGYDGRDSNKIYRSEDGGRRWEAKAVNTGGFSLESITFVQARYGWAVGAGIVLHTDNGGETWRQLTHLTDSHLNEVKFVNAQVGYAAGQTEWGCEVLRTINGGRSWQKIYEAPRAGYVFGIATLGERIAVAAINDSHLIRTEDAGATWHIIDSGLTGAASVTFTSNGVGWLVGRRGGFYRSTDQGKTWARPSNLPRSFVSYDWTSITFADDRSGLAVGNKGMIAITNDGGTTWSELRTDISENLRLARLSGGTGLIIGSQNIYSIVLDPTPSPVSNGEE